MRPSRHFGLRIQKRLSGSYAGTQAVQSVRSGGGVGCSPTLQRQVTGTCTGTAAVQSATAAGHAVVTVSSNGGAGAFAIYEVRSTLHTPPEGGTVSNGGASATFADTATTDEVTFNVASSGSPTHLLDGSLLVWSSNVTSTGNCQYTGSAIVH